MPQPDAILEALERLAAGEPREALAAAARALKEAPRDPDALYLLGAAHYRCGELGPAEARLRQAIAADGATPAFHALMGNVLQDRGDIGEAIKAYRRALRLQPALAEAHNDLGTAYFARGDSERAVECYRRAAALKPGNAVAWANLGAVYRRLGMAREARRALQKELFHRLRALLPRRKVSPAETELERGNPRLAARLAGEGAAARALLERARHRLDVPLARFERGEALLRQGRSAEAEAEVRAALAADAGYVPAWIRLCDILRASGALDEAEACAAAALERDEESAAAWHAAGMVLKEKGRTGAAIERFEKALELEPARVQALLQIGEILRYENRIAEAERRFREGLRLRPDDTGLAVDLAQTLSDQMRYDEAFALLDKVLARKPDSAMALATKGVLLDLTGRAAEAESLLASALAREPGNPDIGYNLAICRLRHGDFDAGWRGFELRRQKENFIGRYRKFPFAEWQGEPLEGKAILVYPEQGLGDELMYASCIGALAARARQVALECDPKLGELFTRSFPQCTVIARRRTFVNDWVNHLEPRPHFQVPIGSLPRFFPSSRFLPQGRPGEGGALAGPPRGTRAGKEDRPFLAGRRRAYRPDAPLAHAGAARARSIPGRNALRQPAVHGRDKRIGGDEKTEDSPLAGGDRRLRRDGGARVRARQGPHRVHGHRAPHRLARPSRAGHGALRLGLALRRERRAHGLVSERAARSTEPHRRLARRPRRGRGIAVSAPPEYAFIASEAARERARGAVLALNALGYDARRYGPDAAEEARRARAVVFCDVRPDIARYVYDVGDPAGAAFAREAYAVTAATPALASAASASLGRPVEVVPEPVEGPRRDPRAARVKPRSRPLEWLARRAGLATDSWRTKLLWMGEEPDVETIVGAYPALKKLGVHVPLALHCVAAPEVLDALLERVQEDAPDALRLSFEALSPEARAAPCTSAISCSFPALRGSSARCCTPGASPSRATIHAKLYAARSRGPAKRWRRSSARSRASTRRMPPPPSRARGSGFS